MGRRHLSQAAVSAAHDRLVALGYSQAPAGRPPKGAKPLAPALAAELGITERRARQLIARRALPPGVKHEANERTRAAARAVRDQLQRALGTKVAIDDNGGVGTLTISYSGYAHLEELMRRMNAL